MTYCQLDVNDETAVHMVRPRNIRSRIQRIRTKLIDYGKNTEDLEDIVIPTGLQRTYNDEPFLFSDSGYYETNKRILIFTTKANLDILKTNDTWYGDGTFSVCPSRKAL